MYNITEFSKKIGVSTNTLRRWDNTGKLKANRTPSNYRFYTEEQYTEYLEKSKR